MPTNGHGLIERPERNPDLPVPLNRVTAGPLLLSDWECGCFRVNNGIAAHDHGAELSGPTLEKGEDALFANVKLGQEVAPWHLRIVPDVL